MRLPSTNNISAGRNDTPAASAGRISTGRLAEVFRQIDFAPREKYGPHSHHRLESNYVKRGACSLRIGNRETGTFKKDDLMVIPSGLAHTFEAGARGTRLIQLEFMPELFGDMIRYSDHDAGFLSDSRALLTVRSNVRIRSLLQTIIRELQHQQDGFKQMVMAGYLQLLILLDREYRSTDTSSDYPAPLSDILRFIDSSKRSDITIASIADKFDITTRYIRKLFAKHLGISPSHFLLGKRIEHAKELLANSDMTLKEISSHCGFSSPRHLHACFTRVMGYPPSKHLG